MQSAEQICYACCIRNLSQDFFNFLPIESHALMRILYKTGNLWLAFTIRYSPTQSSFNFFIWQYGQEFCFIILRSNNPFHCICRKTEKSRKSVLIHAWAQLLWLVITRSRKSEQMPRTAGEYGTARRNNRLGTHCSWKINSSHARSLFSLCSRRFAEFSERANVSRACGARPFPRETNPLAAKLQRATPELSNHIHCERASAPAWYQRGPSHYCAAPREKKQEGACCTPNSTAGVAR